MKEKIIVAMSGGVDSSVVAGLLLEQGYDVIGVNLRTWEYEAPSCDTTKKSCCSPEDIRDARDVGLAFNIPFYVMRMDKIFGEKVIDRFVSDYKNGLTPNPCVECNTFVKFGALFEKAKALGIGKIATGHYANIKYINGRYAIANGLDEKKNQAYYLYGLNQESISNTIFPLGNMNKSEVREHARRLGLKMVSEKKESQEICFIPENDYRKFLEKQNIEFTPGFFKLLDGKIVGKHKGKENFTIGQRKGLGVSWKNPLYVISIEDDGTVILGEESETYCAGFSLEDVNYQAHLLKENETIEARVQIRYRHKPVKCTVIKVNEGLEVKFLEKVPSVTPGQSAIFYPMDNDYILFGGIIQKGSIIHEYNKQLNYAS
ncbi:MAG: tRNA 2-thiouridine(34) synthase MnmA [Leptospiraceae bacterium]|nr:tRNA 2-thiouridine(34) synthase MnmA [Leptospiraceae bacterium]